jgi:hypothetical protein
VTSHYQLHQKSSGEQIAGYALLATLQKELTEILFRDLLPTRDLKAKIWMKIFEIVVAKSETLVEELADSVRTDIARLDARISTSLMELARANEPHRPPFSYSGIYDYLVIRQSALLAEPRIWCNYLETLDKKKMEEFLCDQSDRDAQLYRAVIYAIAGKSALADGERVQLMIYGAPGFGKSRQLDRLVNLLGGPVIKYNAEAAAGLAPVEERNPPYTVKKREETADTATTRNELKDAVRRSGYKNPIVLINEFEASSFKWNTWKAAFFKKLLDPAPEEGDQLRYITIIAVTNDEPADFDPAIANRFIKFHVAPPDGKKQTAQRQQKIDTITAAAQRAGAVHEASDLTHRMARLLDAVNPAAKHVEALFDIIGENNDPGFRTSNQLVEMTTFLYLVTAALSEGKEQGEVSSEDTKTLIKILSASDKEKKAEASSVHAAELVVILDAADGKA